MKRRLVTLAATAAAAAALAVSGASPSSATPSLGYQGLACGGGTILTNSPGGTADQNFRGSTAPDARWFVGLYHYGANGWEFAWSNPYYVATVATNDANLGATWGYIGAWRAVGGNGSVINAVTFNGIPGHYYAVLSWVGDSSGGTWSWSRMGNGNVVCRA